MWKARSNFIKYSVCKFLRVSGVFKCVFCFLDIICRYLLTITINTKFGFQLKTRNSLSVSDISWIFQFTSLDRTFSLNRSLTDISLYNDWPERKMENTEGDLSRNDSLSDFQKHQQNKNQHFLLLELLIL